MSTLSTYQPPSASTQRVRKASERSRRRRIVLMGLGCSIVLLGALAFFAAGRGYKTQLLKSMGLARKSTSVVKVAMVSPEDGATDASVNGNIVVSVRTNRDRLDRSTLNEQTVRLIRTADQKPVAATIRPTGKSRMDITPVEPLDPATNYNLILHGVEMLGGARVESFLTSFTTAGEAVSPVRFEQVALPATNGLGCTALAVGPDGKLYCGTDDGTIHRFIIEPGGQLTRDATIETLKAHARGPRLLIGLVFDPQSTPEAPVVWVTHGFCGFENVPDFTGAITRLTGPNLEHARDVVINLPRSIRDHATNQPAFGPDGALYIPQASNTAFGAPDAFWGMRPERLLSATILRLETAAALKLDRPIDAKTTDAGGSYDPAAPGAPLTIHATGVRLAYELLWHSNGQLYAPTNGASLGGNAPAGDGVPALNNIAIAEDDWLHRIRPGRYYGHPNPAQGHFVLNGGNPTPGYDFAEVPMYPVGTKPDGKWIAPVYVLGQHVSANGVIEYQSNHFNGALHGRLLICRYSRGGDLLALKVDSEGDVVETQATIAGLSGFINPLDVIEDRKTGNLYVSEYGARKVTLCRPK